LGNPQRAAEISDKGSGWVIHAELVRNQALHTKHAVSIKHFAAWWLAEDAFVTLWAFVTGPSGFAGATLVERHGNRVRFKLPGAGQRLGELFRHVEVHKEALSISEYSLSQVTLESVFNGFAKEAEDTAAREGAAREGVAAPSPTPGATAGRKASPADPAAALRAPAPVLDDAVAVVAVGAHGLGGDTTGGGAAVGSGIASSLEVDVERETEGGRGEATEGGKEAEVEVELT
jgi:hypothetical protein